MRWMAIVPEGEARQLAVPIGCYMVAPCQAGGFTATFLDGSGVTDGPTLRGLGTVAGRGEAQAACEADWGHLQGHLRATRRGRSALRRDQADDVETPRHAWD